jgi:prevent-host-death family protein
MDAWESEVAMTLKTMSSNEAKQNWGAVMKTAREADGTVVVESHGKPQVAVISFERYQELRALEARAEQEADLRWLREFEASYDGRNDDLTVEQIEELADRFSREFVDDLVAEGKIRFEGDDKA